MSDEKDQNQRPPATPQPDIWNVPPEPVEFATPVFPDENFEAGSVISYANTRNTIRPMSVKAARWVCTLSYIPAFAGLSILLLYWLTAIDKIAQFGMIWLLIGGAMTAVLGIVSIVFVIKASLRKPKDPVAKLYGWAMGGILLNVMAAFWCANLGASLVDQAHPHIRVINSTPVAIDHLTVHFPDRDIEFWNIPPGQLQQSGFVWLSQFGGKVEITATVGGNSRRKVDRIASRDNLRVDPFVIIVEPAELPAGKTP